MLCSVVAWRTCAGLGRTCVGSWCAILAAVVVACAVEQFVETDVTRVLRYTPSHVKYRSPPNRFARTGRRIK